MINPPVIPAKKINVFPAARYCGEATTNSLLHSTYQGNVGVAIEVVLM
jgi:hypothetical protein